MSDFLKQYGDTYGPLGFPQSDKAAQQLDSVLKALPKTEEYSYRKSVSTATSELNPGERSDVSWISSENPDRTKDVVLARGMNDSQFAQNPLVTLSHSYWQPPVGKSLWRKRVKDGTKVGIKAKTRYPECPGDWAKEDPWPPDKVFSLVKAGLLSGKSIGFLPLKVHKPDDKEYARNGWRHDEVRLVIDEWMLLEYACVFLPANQDALVEAVSKGIELDVPADMRKALGLDDALFQKQAPAPVPVATHPPLVVPFTTLADIEAAVQRQIAGIDFDALARRTVEESYHKARGRV